MEFGIGCHVNLSPMIRILFLVMAIAFVMGIAFVSCVDIDETPEMELDIREELTENPLLGTWFSVTREMDGCINPSMNITQIFHPIECTNNEKPECQYQEIEFRKGVIRMRNIVNFQEQLVDDYNEIEYEIFEDIIKLCFGRSCEDYNYTLENKLLRINIENDKYGCSDTWVLRRI